MNFGPFPVSDGVSGVAQIVGTLAQLKDFYGRSPAIRAASLAICGSKKDNDQTGQISRLADFVRRSVVYVSDPLNLEFIQTPDVLLLEINARGTASGDCDCHCLLFASLCESIGIPCAIVGVKSGSLSTFNHVVCLVELPAGALVFDLCAKFLNQPAYSEFLEP